MPHAINVELSYLDRLVADIDGLIPPGYSLIEQDLVDRGEATLNWAKRTKREVQAKIAYFDAKIIECEIALPAAAVEDAAAAASGEEGGAVEALEREIDRCRVCIATLRPLIHDCEDIYNRISDDLDDYRNNIAQYDRMLQERTGIIGTAARDFRSDLSKPMVGSIQCGGLEEDIFSLATASIGAIGDIAFSASEDADNLRDYATASSLDNLRKTEGRLGHRAPSMKNGRWTDSVGNPIDGQPNIASGVFCWHPNKDKVFGGKKSNPDEMTAGQICELFGFESIRFVDGYPVFPESTVVARVKLVSSLSAERPKNFSQADALLASSGGKGVDEATREDVKAFMMLYGGGDWFNNQTQVKKYRSTRKLTWHETQDMNAIELIPAAVHSMVVHDGGVSNAKYREKVEKDLRYLARAAMEALV